VLDWAQTGGSTFVSDGDVIKRWERARLPINEKDMTIRSLLKIALLQGYQPKIDDYFEILGEQEDIIDVWNKRFALVKLGTDVVIASEDECRSGGFSYYSESAFRMMHSHETKSITSGEMVKKVPIYDFWKTSPKARRCPRGLSFCATGTPEGTFNLWKGYAFKSKKGDWGLFRKFIFESACGRDKIKFDYLMKWFAYCIQNPDKPAGVAVVVSGLKGTGKNFIFERIGALFGPSYMYATQSEQLAGRFNGHLANKAFILADEAFFAGNKEHEKAMKALITNMSATYEFKGKSPIMGDNHVSLAMISNDLKIVNSSADERRYFILTMSDEFRGNFTHFENMDEQMLNGGSEAMLHDFLAMDLSNFVIQRIPQTKEMTDNIFESLKPEESWLVEVALNGDWFPTQTGGFEWSGMIDFKEAHRSYLEYISVNKITAFNMLKGNGLGRFLKKAFASKKVNENKTCITYYEVGTINEFRQKLNELFNIDLELD